MISPSNTMGSWKNRAWRLICATTLGKFTSSLPLRLYWSTLPSGYTMVITRIPSRISYLLLILATILFTVFSLTPQRKSLIRMRRYQWFHSVSVAFSRMWLTAVLAASPVSWRLANCSAVFQKVSGFKPRPLPVFSSTCLMPNVIMLSRVARRPRKNSSLPAVASRLTTASLNRRLLSDSSSMMTSQGLFICVPC